jgi:GrpB-like predicted nucleotidyltransferase (UPF0157 family)
MAERQTSRTGKPIVIADYDSAWAETFTRERELIVRACGAGPFVRIEHMGSTAVPGLGAKPIIDIKPGLRSLDDALPLIPLLATIGYEYGFDDDIPERRYFRKDVNGERAFHMHMVETSSDFWRDHLRFRNFLRYSEEDRAEYERVKRRLAAEYNAHLTPESNINLGYTEYKTGCIAAIMAKAEARIERSEPVVIVDYDAAWPARFERERDLVLSAAGSAAVAIEHAGSTSVPGLAAKPIVDMVMGVRDMAGARAAAASLSRVGYAMDSPQHDDWVLFNKIGDRQTHHLHAVPHEGVRWRRYVGFRDWLRAQPDDVAAYGDLKRALAAEFGHDRLGYVEAKTDFVNGILRRAGVA